MLDMTPAPEGVVTNPTTFAGSNLPAAPLTAPGAKVRKRWYRRKLIVIPLALLMVALAVGGYAGWRVYDSFSTINHVSTPPPVLSGVSLGGDANVTIDTGPAQAAVETYEASKKDGGLAAANDPTEPANDIAAVTDPTEKVDPESTVSATEPAPSATVQGDTNFVLDVTPTIVVTESDPEPTATDADGEIIAADDETPIATDENSADAGVEPPTESTSVPFETEPTSAPPEAEPTITPAEPEVAPTEGPVLVEPTTAPLPNFGEDTLDILLMGVDAQDGESIDVGVRPDALAVLHLDRSTGTCRILAIPRDTRVELPGYGLSKINHALAVGGVPYEQQVVEQYLGIEMDHYALIDFGGVVKIVDEVGGVEVDNPVAFSSIGIEFPAGKQVLDGQGALAYARFRSDDQGDFGRIGRQQEVLRAVMKKVSPGDLVGMIPQMLSLLVDHFRTDLSPLDLADIARAYGSSCTYDTLETSTLQGTTGTFYDPLIQLDLSYVIIDDVELQRKKEWLLGG